MMITLSDFTSKYKIPFSLFETVISAAHNAYDPDPNNGNRMPNLLDEKRLYAAVYNALTKECVRQSRIMEDAKMDLQRARTVINNLVHNKPKEEGPGS